MMLKCKLAFITLVMIGMQSVFSQGRTVSGLVTDAAGLPIPGVTVLIEGTTNGASTDFDGNYTLNNVLDTDSRSSN